VWYKAGMKKIVPTKTDSSYRIGPPNTSFGCRVVLVNPGERDWKLHRYVLAFGACAPTYLMVWARGLQDGLEVAAEWLAEHAPGHVMAEYGEEHLALIREAAEGVGVEFEDISDLDDARRWEVQDAAEADLTRTESGFLTSYEWSIVAEDPSREELVGLLYPAGIRWTSDDGLLTAAAE